MGSITRFVEAAFRRLLPSPFSIALLLTLLVIAGAWWLHDPSEAGPFSTALSNMWYRGIWNAAGMVFLVQMMLILILGHVLALSKPVHALMERLLKLCDTPVKAVLITAALAMVMAWINWGLGLIAGAIMARKCAEHLSKLEKPFHYPLLAAAGYTGLMIWHGGMSGSSLIKVAETGHLRSLMEQQADAGILPEAIALDLTVFNTHNIITCLILATTVLLTLWWLSKRTTLQQYAIRPTQSVNVSNEIDIASAEKLDHARWFAVLIGLGVLYLSISAATRGTKGMAFLTPNFINACLLGMALIAHRSIFRFSQALQEAIAGGSGILIQFPLYFGIMGLMKESGLVQAMADFFIDVSSPTTLPLMSFMSAGLVNFFVPSGGGQWYVQGPVILQSCMEMGVPLEKGIMSLAYGDQITNMLQPFWALPLLGITRVKARDMIPYTFLLFLVGALVLGISVLL